MTCTAPTRPTTGTCRWLRTFPCGTRELEVTTRTGTRVYEVSETDAGYLMGYVDTAKGEIVTYRITRPNGAWVCSCPAWKYGGPKQCKHVKAIRAALNAEPF